MDMIIELVSADDMTFKVTEGKMKDVVFSIKDFRFEDKNSNQLTFDVTTITEGIKEDELCDVIQPYLASYLISAIQTHMEHSQKNNT